MSQLAAIFWALLILGIYPYVAYPAAVWLLSRLLNHTVHRKAGFCTRVTIIIAAYNEARLIEATVRNKLEQNYPDDLIEILVVSDGSNDGTDGIVSRLAQSNDRVRLIRQEPRQGKTAALNLAAQQASGELLVFADANSIYRPDSLSRLVSNFADPAVGYVTGRTLYANPDGSLIGDGCTAYMKYENALWSWETKMGSIVGVDGAIDGIRRSLYRPMKPDQLPDFVLSLDVVEQGFRVVYDSEAIVTEEALNTEVAEQRMRVRVALRGLWAIWDRKRLLNFVRYPLFSWQLASHKLLRYLSPLPLLLAAAINWALLGVGVVYYLVAASQALFLLLVISRYWKIQPLGDLALSRYCLYFALLNWSSLLAVWQFIRGKKKVLWQPRIG